jgi:hypothetical protein
MYDYVRNSLSVRLNQHLDDIGIHDIIWLDIKLFSIKQESVSGTQDL